MSSQGKYIDLWTKKRNRIEEKLKVAAIEQSIQLNYEEFENVGDRAKNNYTFNLEFNNGTVCNNVGGSAVARDLAKVLENSENIRELLKTGHYKFNLDRNFNLWIKKK